MPEQIAGRLQRAYPDDMRKHLSAETIYVCLYVLPAEPCAANCWRRYVRRARRADLGRRGGGSTGPDPPYDADDRVPRQSRDPHGARPLGGRPDQWGSQWAAVGILVERTTRLVLLARMEGTDARSAREGFTKKLRHVPAPLLNTLTYDRAKRWPSMSAWQSGSAIRVFFADPYSSWQRGTNENTNGLLRQQLPKGTDLSGYTQHELNAIAHRLNTRPRKCLHFATPLEVYAHLRHHSPVALGT